MPLSKYDIELDLANTPDTSHALLVGLIGSNKRVLDVGCDTGYLGEALEALGNETSGFEVNEVSAQQARTRMHRVEVGDLEAVDLVELFGRGAFDVVVFGDVLEHLRDPLPVLRQARALLAPGGSVVLSVPNIAHGDIRLALLRGRFRYTKVGLLDETHTRFFTRESLVEFLRDAGFVLADLRRTTAALFTTEQGLTEADFDPALVAELRRDPEATTYQFVARAVPDDAATLDTAQALRIDELNGELHGQARAIEGYRAELDGLRAERDALLAERDAARAECDVTAQRATEERAAAHRALQDAQRELSASRDAYQELEATRAVRLARSARRVLPPRG